jgi:hypothetical protein
MAKYKTKSGEWLSVTECLGGYLIGWESEDTCAYDSPLDESAGDKEFTIAARAVKPFASVDQFGNGHYVFISKRIALKALAAANTALHRMASGVKLPGWATKALAAGWKAPKGWRP